MPTKCTAPSSGRLGTGAELSAVGLPAAFVPLPIGNGEQRRNALPVVEAGGGLLVEDAELSPAWIGSTLAPLLVDPAALAGYARHAAAAGVADADERLADIVLSVAAGRRPPEATSPPAAEQR